MGGAAIAFLSGLGAGYLSQTEKDKDRERQAKLDQVTLDRADRETETYNREKKDRDALRAAGAPVTVNSNAAMLGTSGKPTLYEDGGVAGSDFRQARNMAEQTGAAFADQAPTPAITVAGKQYQDTGAAQTAATAANTPEARSQRVMAAVSGIDPIKALDLENQQVTRGRETTKFTQEQSDRQWRQDLGVAMQSGHEGLAAMVSKSQGGPMAGVNLKPMPSADGLTVNYAKVNPDGSTTPTNLTFSNDQSGITQAAYMLDKAITPEHRMDNEMKRVTEARLSKAGDSLGKYHEALADAAGVRAEAATTKAENGSGKTAYERMPEDLRLQYQGHLKAAKDARDDVRKLEIANNGDLSGAALVTADRYRKEAAGYDMKANTLLKQYRTEDAPTDKLGFRGPATPTPKTTVAQGGIAKYASPLTPRPGDSDKTFIFQQEMAKAQARLSVPNLSPEEMKRAQDDVAGIQREMGRAGIQQSPANAAPLDAPPAVQPAVAKPAIAAPIAAAPGTGIKPVAAAPAATQQIAPVVAIDPNVLAARLESENAEMGVGKRMAYSREVQIYVARLKAEKDAVELAASQAYRSKELKQTIAQRQGTR